MSWTVLFTKQAQKDARKLASASPALKQKAQALLDILAVDPDQQPPPYAALVGDLRGACSRRINIQHRTSPQTAARGGQLAPWRRLQASSKVRRTAGCRPSPCSPTAKNRTAPRKPDGHKLSNDPFYVEKVRDIVGLYLNPPDKAVVLCVDEKTQIQALDRTQPLLPMGLDYIEGVTHDTIRHGTTTLFAALDVATGSVIAECKPRHRHKAAAPFSWPATADSILEKLQRLCAQISGR